MRKFHLMILNLAKLAIDIASFRLAVVEDTSGYGMRGAIWYQGESNHTEETLYFKKKKALLEFRSNNYAPVNSTNVPAALGHR